MEPLWPEPYMHGMKTAQRIHDLEGIEWATVGILSQGWPANQSEIWKTARRVAKATLEELRAEKRDQGGGQVRGLALKAALRARLRRQRPLDGDADVDLLVEEPTGSVCSLRNLRTHCRRRALRRPLRRGRPGGGSKAIAKCTSAPRASAATYKLLVRRVWGQVVTGKVSVEVVTPLQHPQGQANLPKDRLGKGAKPW